VDAEELTNIREQVAATGDAIQPLLLPHAGLARRNAYAHIWLGISAMFGDQWRSTAIAGEVIDFVRWIGANPNEDYGAFTGPTTRLPASDRTPMPRASEKATPQRSMERKISAEPSLFDAPNLAEGLHSPGRVDEPTADFGRKSHGGGGPA
jgi:hypothetical protein